MDFPAGLRERLSGACLAFVVARLNGHVVPLDPPLTARLPVGRGRRRLLLRAALVRPELSLPGTVREQCDFVAWLALGRRCLSDSLLLACHHGLDDLAERLADEVAATRLGEDTATHLLHALPDTPSGVATIRRLLPLRLSLVMTRSDELLRLLDVAVRIDAWSTVSNIAQLLESAAEDAETLWTARSARLTALAERHEHHRVAREYREVWQSTARPHRRPARILYSLQMLAEPATVGHLLQHGDFSECDEAYALLALEGADGRVPGSNLLARWAELFVADPRNEPVAVGFTDALLRCSVVIREPIVRQHRLREFWRDTVARIEGYEWLGRAFHVRLAGSEEDLVAAYEAELADAPTSRAPVRAAIRDYVAVLRRRRLWDRLANVAPSHLAVCSFGEQVFAEQAATLSRRPQGYADEQRWCRAWERLVGASPRSDYVRDVLAMLVTARRMLRDGAALEDAADVFADVSRQILFHATLECEQLIARIPEELRPSPPDLARLDAAGYIETLHMLDELLAVAAPNEI